MSFLIDPALLYAGGRAYRRLTDPAATRPGAAAPAAPAPDASSAARDAAVGAAFMVVFWGVSVGLYLDQGWTKPLWKLCRARSGRDWMLNSGVFRFDFRDAGRRTHVVSALIFATYPLWLWLGMRRRRADV
jgi:hypothetical protein